MNTSSDRQIYNAGSKRLQKNTFPRSGCTQNSSNAAFRDVTGDIVHQGFHRILKSHRVILKAKRNPLGQIAASIFN